MVSEMSERNLALAMIVPMREAPAEFSEVREETQIERVIWEWGCKCGWGRMWFCSPVRSTLFPVPNPQEDKIKENDI